jgi:hypothetical protein
MELSILRKWISFVYPLLTTPKENDYHDQKLCFFPSHSFFLFLNRVSSLDFYHIKVMLCFAATPFFLSVLNYSLCLSYSNRIMKVKSFLCLSRVCNGVGCGVRNLRRVATLIAMAMVLQVVQLLLQPSSAMHAVGTELNSG